MCGVKGGRNLQYMEAKSAKIKHL